MVCDTYTFGNNEDFLSLLNDRVCTSRIPLSGSIDLTDKCNLNCVHCYIHNDRIPDRLSADQINGLVDQLADAGCLFLLLTGGEPLLRKDFKEIYEHAKRVGLLVSLFTNGTLIDEDLADFFVEFPPQLVEISLYGATADVHDMVTGVEGSFDMTMRGLELLIERGVDVNLKSILMTINKDDMAGMLDIADKHGVKFRVDGEIFPRLDGNQEPLKLRLDPADVVAREFMIPQRVQHWRSFVEKIGELKPSESLYDCGAGINCFHITSAGFLKPCIMVSEPKFDITDKMFCDAWRDMAVISDRKIGADYPCSGCDKRVMCDSCPGFFGLEMGTEDVYSQYVCDIARERERHLAEVVA